MQLCPATVLKCQEAIPISNNEMRKIHRGGEGSSSQSAAGRKVNVSQSRREQPVREPGKPGKAPKEKAKHPILRFIGRTIATLLCLGIMAGSLLAVGMVFYVVQATANDGDLLDLDNIQLSQSSVVMANDPDTGAQVEYATLRSSNSHRVWADLEQIPTNLQYAFICTEDKDFYNEPGVNFKRTIGAMVNEYLLPIYSSKQGASTLEQQLIKNLTSDKSASGVEGALRKLCEIKRGGVILCDSTKPEVLHKLKEQVELASQNERERLAVGCVAKEQAAQTAKSLNCERMVLCCQKAGMKEESLTVCAAAVAAMLAVGEAMDSYHSRPLEGIEQLEPLSEQEIETLLGDGVTVLEMADGQAECIRCVTTRTRTGNEEDRTFSSVNVVMMIDEIIRAVRERLSEMLKGKRVGFSQDSVVSQAAVVLDEKKQQGLITSFEPPVAYVQKEDPSVCVVELEFDLAAVFSRIYLTAHISI